MASHKVQASVWSVRSALTFQMNVSVFFLTWIAFRLFNMNAAQKFQSSMGVFVRIMNIITIIIVLFVNGENKKKLCVNWMNIHPDSIAQFQFRCLILDDVCLPRWKCHSRKKCTAIQRKKEREKWRRMTNKNTTTVFIMCNAHCWHTGTLFGYATLIAQWNVCWKRERIE